LVFPVQVYNFSLVAYAEVVQELTLLKHAHENQTDIFGPSQMKKGSDDSLMMCANTHPECVPGAHDWPVCCQMHYSPQPTPGGLFCSVQYIVPTLHNSLHVLYCTPIHYTVPSIC
jgi:hypothetical protein